MEAEGLYWRDTIMGEQRAVMDDLGGGLLGMGASWGRERLW